MGCGASAEAPPPKKTFVFRVKVIGGLNLFNNGFGLQLPGTKTSTFNFNGKSDPYVKIQVGNQYMTSTTILNTQNPTWNEEFYFTPDTCEPTIEFRVYDKDVASSDDCIGFKKLSLKGMISKEKEHEYWVPLEGSRSNGELGFSVVECFRMNVLAKQGINVEPKDALSGSSDCYMTIQVGQQEKHKTATKGWTLNPVWNQKFTCYVPYGVPSQLQCILWDHDTVGVNENMGWAYTMLDGKPQHGKQRELEMKIAHASGTLQLMLQDDTTVESAPAGQVTEADRAKFPPPVPQTATFQCRVLGAYNLAAADHNYATDFANAVNAELFHEFKENTGTSDPYARVEVEGQVYETHHINNTLEPWWNTNMRFVARSKDSSQLVVKVFDHDLIADDAIGSVTLPLNMMKPGERTEMWSFLDKGRGELGLELSMDFQLKVRIVSCSDLPAKDLNGMCDPYVKMKLSGQEHKTKTIHDNRSPWFEEDVRFALPTLKDAKLEIEVWDADLTLFKQALSEDLCGTCSIPLDNLPNGIPQEMELPLMVTSKQQGTIKLVITNEIPIPPSALDLLEKQGKEAFNKAVAKLTETADLIKTLKLPDFDKKEEGEIEPFDPKIDARPRYSKLKCEIVACRGLKLNTPQMYVGVSLPLQGQRYKTKEYSETKNPNIGEVFEFGCPSKKTGGFYFEVFESNKSNYTSWNGNASAKVYVPIEKLYKGEGLIRGSPADHYWISFPEGGEICVAIFEKYRWNVRIEGATGLKPKKDPYVQIQCGKFIHRTHTVPADPAKDRTEGIPGHPIWNQQFTFYTESKEDQTVKLSVRDEGMVSDENMGECSFSLGEVSRGVPKTLKLPLSQGGEITVWLKEEEKMGLLDRIIDSAANAAKLAQALASEVSDKAKDAASNAANAVSGALGGLFGK